MRISDWSSDVCSSDLEGKHHADDRRQGNGGKVARDDRWRADADGHFPDVEQGMAQQPDRGRSPKQDAPLRPCHPDQESGARSEGSRGGKGGVSTCRFRGRPVLKKKNKTQKSIK